MQSIKFRLPFKNEYLTIVEESEGFFITRFRESDNGYDVIVIDQIQGCFSHHVANNIEQMIKDNRGESNV